MNQNKLNILIADDDYSYCQLLSKALTNRGHSVEMSYSGDDTILHLEKNKYDILVLDYKMEGTNGINVLQWIYSKKLDLPVILITAYGNEEIYEEAFKWGATEYFTKGDNDVIKIPQLVEQVYRKYKS